MDVKTKRSELEVKKSCIDCHTTRTPLWRSGPVGPRSLCNACGIRYRKRKKALAEKRKKRNSNGSSLLGISLKAIGRDMREEEQAAVLLMSLKCTNH